MTHYSMLSLLGLKLTLSERILICSGLNITLDVMLCVAQWLSVKLVANDMLIYLKVKSPIPDIISLCFGLVYGAQFIGQNEGNSMKLSIETLLEAPIFVLVADEMSFD